MTDITPAQLALELNVTSKHVRDLLRDEYDLLPPMSGRWLLSADKADAIRAKVGKRNDKLGWLLQPGDEVRRKAIHDVYGGQQQGGISTPRSIGDVLIFTDPDSGKKYGYDKYEGLREDGNYSYTGEGRVGDQSIDKRGNAALVRSTAGDTVIRLFRAYGVYVTYVGAFTLGSPGYWERLIPDQNGALRRAFVFNLEPIDADTELLPPYGGELLDDVVVKKWVAPAFSEVIVKPDQIPTPLEERTVSRIEFKLQNDFGTWLKGKGHKPQSLELRVDGSRIMPDLYVPALGWVVEAKRSTARAHVRTAIGQILDYVHVARQKEDLKASSLVPLVLFPGAPSDSLVDLIHSLGITLAYRSPKGSGFTVVEPS